MVLWAKGLSVKISSLGFSDLGLGWASSLCENSHWDSGIWGFGAGAVGLGATSAAGRAACRSAMLAGSSSASSTASSRTARCPPTRRSQGRSWGEGVFWGFAGCTHVIAALNERSEDWWRRRIFAAIGEDRDGVEDHGGRKLHKSRVLVFVLK